MRIYFSEDHRLHFPQAELSGGAFVTPYERPSRMEYVLARLKERGLRDLHAPGAVDMAPVDALHKPDYLEFLRTAWAEWKAAGCSGEIIAPGMPTRSMQQARAVSPASLSPGLPRSFLVFGSPDPPTLSALSSLSPRPRSFLQALGAAKHLPFGYRRTDDERCRCQLSCRLWRRGTGNVRHTPRLRVRPDRVSACRYTSGGSPRRRGPS